MSALTLATVTATAPLTVQRDGDTDPVPVAFAPAGLTVGARVVCVELDNRVTVLTGPLA